MSEPLYDTFGRKHDYLRVSLTERCNLRCRYCMPEEGIELSPRHHICSRAELLHLIDRFISLGVRKVRLTGGEPLVRKDAGEIIDEMAQRPVSLAMTTNAVLVDRYINRMKNAGLTNLNISLDSLDPDRFMMITRRTHFEKVMANIHLLLKEDFNLKINCVVMRGMNEDEIPGFVEWTRHLPISVRFIEFMPFDGNRWQTEKMVSYAEIMEHIRRDFTFERLDDAPNDTTKHYRVPGYTGNFGVISSMTEHFCGSCNRIRLMANGAIKNCLFSDSETDLLTPLRQGEDVEPIIRESIRNKKASHAGMENLADQPNRSMITIGG